jgi:hypothetical protein
VARFSSETSSRTALIESAPSTTCMKSVSPCMYALTSVSFSSSCATCRLERVISRRRVFSATRASVSASFCVAAL